MIEQFRQNRLGIGLLLVIAALSLRVLVLFFVKSNPLPAENIGILTHTLQWVNGHLYISVLLSFALLVLQSYLVNSICIVSGALNGSGILGTYFFLILNSMFIDGVFFSMSQIGNLLMLFGLSLLFQLKEGFNTRLLFYSSFLFGIGILLIPDHIWILVFVIFGILIFKAINIKDVIAVVIGLAMPFYIAKSWSYLFQIHTVEIGNLNVIQLSLKSLLTIGLFPSADYVVMAIFLCVAILGLFQQVGTYFSKNIEARRSISLNALFFFYTLIMLILHWRDFQHFHSLASIPSAFLLVSFFNEDRLGWWKRILNVILLVLVVFSLLGRFIL